MGECHASVLAAVLRPKKARLAGCSLLGATRSRSFLFMYGMLRFFIEFLTEDHGFTRG